MISVNLPALLMAGRLFLPTVAAFGLVNYQEQAT
jgi:hypothetical protein